MSAAALTSLLQITARKILGWHLPCPVIGAGCLSFFFARDSLFHYSHTCRSVCKVIPNCPSVPKMKASHILYTTFLYLWGGGKGGGEGGQSEESG